MKFYPAILTGSGEEAQRQLDLAGSFAECSIVQIDIIDGLYADEITITPADLAECEFGQLQCDLHLMTVDPEDALNEAIEFATVLPIRAVIGQVEKMGSEHSFVEAVRRQGWQAGLSLDLDTSLDSIDESIWPELQFVQVMGVRAGEQGQIFAQSALKLVGQLDELRRTQALAFELTVDGGIRPEVIAKLAARHVDSCSVGSFIWKSSDPEAQWQALPH